MAGENVSVRLTLVDNVSKKLSDISTQMDRVIQSMERFGQYAQTATNSLTGVTQAVAHLGNVTDNAFDSPELKQAATNFDKVEKEARELAETEARLKKESDSTASSTRNLNKELSKTSTVSSSATSGISSLTSSLKGLAASFVSVYSAQKLIDTSDSLILSEGKLSNLTDNVNGLKNDIYQMSQDTRTSYLNNMSQMAKMWQLTGGSSGVFDTEDKLLQFNEVLNKAFVLGGSGTREINASMYQLTQALSSGRLQGDELRSLAENAPYLIDSITDSLEAMYNKGKDQSEWIDLTYGDLKELGAEGVLTSDMIVDAVLNSTDQIRDAYENITPTFAQIWETIKNQAIKISEPILKKLNEIFNSEAFEKTAQVLMKMIAMIVAALTPLIDAILWIGEVMADNWAIVEPILWGIIGTLILIKTYTLGVAAATKVLAGVTAIVNGIKNAYEGWLLISGLVRQAQGKEIAMKQLWIIQSYKQAVAEGTLNKNKMFNLVATYQNMKATLADAGAKGVATGATGLLSGAMATLNAVLYANPILWVVIAIVALISVIYLAVKAWNHFKDDTLTVLGAVAGGVAWLGGWIANIFIGIYNVGITCLKYIAAGFMALGALIHDAGVGIWNGMVAVAEGITNAFIYMKNVLKNVFNTLFGWIIDGVNGILKGINAVIDGYNAVAGTLGGSTIDHLGTIEYDTKIVDTNDGFVDFSQYKKTYDNATKVFSNTLDSLETMDEWKVDYVDPNEWAQAGREWGDNATNSIGDWWNGLTDGMDYDDYMTDLDLGEIDGYDALENYLNSQPDYDSPSLSGSGELSPELSDALDSISGDTSDIADSVSVTEQQVELLRELAERRAINRFTTAELKITNNISNNVSSDVDLDGIASYVEGELSKALVSCAESANRY